MFSVDWGSLLWESVLSISLDLLVIPFFWAAHSGVWK